MKNFFATLILFGFVFLTQAQSINSNTFWLSVETSPIDETKGYFGNEGLIINFNNENLKFTKVFKDTMVSKRINIESGNINSVPENELMGKIVFNDKDSLLMELGENSRVKFLPLKHFEKNDIDPDYWHHRSWILERGKVTENLRLYNNLKNIIDDRFICFSEIFYDGNKYSNREYWDIKIIDSIHLFTKTSHQMDLEFYNVIDYKKDTVILESLSSAKHEIVKLKKESSITKGEKKKIRDVIINKLWKTTEVLHTKSSLIEGYEEYDGEGNGVTGFFLNDTVLVNNESILNKEIAFKFKNNNNFEMIVSDSIFNKSKWELSETGKQIILKDGRNKEDYLDIIKFTEDSLTIGRIDKFGIGKSNRDYVEIYYIVKMIE